MTIIQLKLGQKVLINGVPAIYKGINKVKINIGRVDRIVFQGEGKENKKLFRVEDGKKTLESEKILIQKTNLIK